MVTYAGQPYKVPSNSNRAWAFSNSAPRRCAKRRGTIQLAEEDALLSVHAQGFDLLQQAVQIIITPAFNDFAARDAINLHACNLDAVVRGWDAHQLAGVRTAA